MKLRNKKTGAIFDDVYIRDSFLGDDCLLGVYQGSKQFPGSPMQPLGRYNSLAELNAEWCDVEDDDEEPKVKKHDFYYINENGGVLGYVPYDPDGEDLSYMKYQKEIGNHFKTREEAKKAVEKLKAYRRLKDKGFRFDGKKYYNSGSIEIKAYVAPVHIPQEQSFLEDLDLLFGGKE